MQSITLKLILRSWWRNKVFAIISILSLAVGITCTNVLIAYAIYELGVEAKNPERDNIVFMTQDSPMVSGEQVVYVYRDVPGYLKENYPEVKDYLQLGWTTMRYVEVGENRYDPMLLVTADSTFAHFFPYETLYGDLDEALSVPNKIALSESYASRLFGRNNPVGQMLTVAWSLDHFFRDENEAETTTFEVAAVLKDYPQSYLKFDALMRTKKDFTGGVTLLRVDSSFDKDAFARKIKKDNVSTLGAQDGRYYFYSLEDSYFQEFSVIAFVNRTNRMLLYVGLVSALLILLIACFNYVNLSFSRILQQVRMIYTQRLMGASNRNIYCQLFVDTLLTVLVAFLLSLLFTIDLLPLFNKMISGRLSLSFLFSEQVFPVIGGFILLLSVLPAIYLSRQVTRMSHLDYRMQFMGSRKRRVVAVLSVAQFAISIGLLFATQTIYRQLDLTKSNGERYRNLVEIGSWQETGSSRIIESLAKEIQRYPRIGEVSLSKSSVWALAMRQMVVKRDDGTEEYHSMVQFGGDSNYLKVMDLNILQGLDVSQAMKQYAIPVYINRQYQCLFVPKGENPVGKEVRLYDTYFGQMEKVGEPPAVIAGVIEDLYTNGMQSEVNPGITYIFSSGPYSLIQVRLNENNRQEMLEKIKATWEKMAPELYFTYRDLYDVYLEKSNKTIELSHLLVMYSLISILLTLSGLFGIVLYATEQRAKEIGIRKINGAKIWQIIYGLNKPFVEQILVAYIIAVPIVWIMLDNWLSSFVYRVNVCFTDTLIAGVAVLLLTLFTVSWHGYIVATYNPVNTLRSE